jgi:GTP-binding protein EngB required for normal cell division
MAYLAPEEEEEKTERILFIGLSQAGKTSIIQVAFEGMHPEDTLDNQATVRFRTKRIPLKDNVISVIVPFIEESLNKYRETIYSDLKTLIFVIDASVPELFENAYFYFKKACKSAFELNEELQVKVLAHKIDLVPAEKIFHILQYINDLFDLFTEFNTQVFPTSIFDDTLFTALGDI